MICTIPPPAEDDDHRTARGHGYIAGLDRTPKALNPYDAATRSVAAEAWEAGRQQAWPEGRDI